MCKRGTVQGPGVDSGPEDHAPNVASSASRCKGACGRCEKRSPGLHAEPPHSAVTVSCQPAPEAVSSRGDSGGGEPAQGSAADAVHERSERLIALGTIAGLIAHEFNNLLTPVVSYSQMALDAPDDRELATKALQKALAGSERAAQIAEVILGFVREGVDDFPTQGAGDSRSTWNGARSGRTPTASVRQALDNALLCMARSPERDGIRLEIDITPSVAAAIRPIALQHVLLNLILNAREAMCPGGGSLRISAKLSTASSALAQGFNGEPAGQSPLGALIGNEPSVEITVQDTGRGMTTKQIENLFVPIQTKSVCGPEGTADRASSTEGGRGERRVGTGLGMTICKRLVEDAGGYLTVRSAVNQGTTMRIVLPAARLDAEAPAPTRVGRGSEAA